MSYAKQVVTGLLGLGDIHVNGSAPHDVQVHDPRFYSRVLSQGSLGLGESYMEGMWDCPSLDQFFDRLLSSGLKDKARQYLGPREKARVFLTTLASKLSNLQSISKSRQVAEHHYDLGNDFYQHMLDPQYMQYTCAYFKDTDDLQQAQINKLDLVCRKLHLPQKTQRLERVLELGSGFGGFANFAAANYNCTIESYNISKEQVEFARKLNKDLPVTTIESDYRNAESEENNERFDKVASIGMMEHVGPRNYRNFMRIAHNCLKDQGLFLVHTIAGIKTQKEGGEDPWIKKYIFPGGHLPSAAQIAKASEGYFQLEDMHNIGHDYDKTLMAWFENFNKNWPKFKNQYGERFYRMWKYYLLSCAGGFRSGSICLYQTVFSKNPRTVYESAR